MVQTAKSGAQRYLWMRLAARVAVPAGILVLCGWVLGQKVSMDVLRTLPARLADISPWQWAVACGLTTISLYSVGRYDLLAHRFLKTGIPDRAARWTGSIAISVGQSLGFGLFTGAVVRWRMLPALSGAQSLKLSAFVAVTFILAWTVVASIACLILPAPTWSKWVAGLGLISAYAGFFGLFFWPKVRILSWHLPLPSWRLTGGIMLWAFVDTLAATGALFVMLPADAVSLMAFYPVFLIAMGTALFSNTPGGLGPFEVVMLSALPSVGVEAMMTAILAYRVVYYAIPACLGALALLRPFRTETRPAPRPLHDLSTSARSEIGVVRQNGGRVCNFGSATMALWPTGQTLSLLADPVSSAPQQAVETLTKEARQSALIPMLYKSGPRLAAAARDAGWHVLHVADDALLPLADYNIDTPRRRTLRRKLRQADKAGVTIEVNRPLPYSALARVDDSWQRSHGHARGGSMGRYCPHYIADQWVGVAKQDSEVVAFLTAHMAQDEWCVDIMRFSDDAPDGTMHSLVHTAALEARKRGAGILCLAATPACPDPASAFWRWAAFHFVARTGGGGLRQFKSSFGPVWRPRYAASTTAAGLIIGLADILRAVQFPGPIPAASTNATHESNENYEVASQRAA